MCYWGEALAYGPNINAPMDADANARAVGARRLRQRLGAKVTPAERALTEALAKRYSADPKATGPRSTPPMPTRCWTSPGATPPDDDIALLAAEAAMDTSPWDYWQPDKQSRSRASREAVRLVEGGATPAIPTIRRPRNSTST